MMVFWCGIYVLALFSVFVARVMARKLDAKKAPAKSRIRNG